MKLYLIIRNELSSGFIPESHRITRYDFMKFVIPKPISIVVVALQVKNLFLRSNVVVFNMISFGIEDS